MSKSAQSVLAFSIYLLLVGPGLLLAPNFLLGLLGIAPTQEVWIRVIGMLAIILGYYYLAAARGESRAFFAATVHGRFAVLGFFAAFVVLGLGPPALLVFGFVDAVGGLWTAVCLKRDRVHSPPEP